MSDLINAAPTPAKRAKSVTRRQKALAIMAAGVVVGVGATVTLAVWNDSEWVTGGTAGANGNPGTPGVGTSTFEVQQNTSLPFAAGAWTDAETNPGGSLVFSAGALNLSPGESIYAPVSLSTTAGSVAADSIALSAAVAASNIPVVDAGGALFSALTLRAVVSTSAKAAVPAACGAAAFSSPGASYVVGSAAAAVPLASAGATTQALAAAGGDKLDYCFQISLPSGASSALQGRTVAPAWQFVATSAE